MITTTAPAQDNASSISIAGTAEANSTVTLYNNGVSIGTAAADGTGHWSVNSIALTDNTNYSFTAKATDAAGNTSTASTALAFHDDQTAPAAPTVALASDTGSSSSDHITSNGSLTVTPAEAGGTIQYSTNGGTTWTGSFTAVEGANNVEVRQVDAAGNNGAATSFSFTLDTTAPLAPVITTTAPAQDNASSISIAGTAEANSTVTLYNNGVSIGTAAADGTGHWSVNSIALTDNTNYSFTAKATDAAGNTSTASTALAFHDDQTAPAAPTVALASDTGSSSSDHITSNGSLTVTPAEAGGTIQYSTNGGTTWTGSFTAVEGANNVEVRQVDAAGNNGAATSFSFTLDTTAPLAPVITTTAPAQDNASSISIAGTAEANSTVTLYNNGVSIGTAAADGTGHWSVNSIALTDNTNYSFTAKATDAAGNTSTASTALAFHDDQTAPAAPTVALASDTGSSSSDHITSNGSLTVTPAEAGGTIQYSTNGGTTWTGSFTAVEGANNVEVRQVDAAGNNGAATSFSFTLDTTAPLAPVITTTAPAQDNASSISIAGTAEANSTVTLYNNGVSIGTAAADGTGHWSVNSIALTDNTNYSFTAKATDAAGNTSTASTALAFHDDQTAPTGGTPDLVAGSDSGSSNTDNLTNVTSPTFTVALNSTVAVGDTVQLLLGGSALAHNVLHTITAADVTAGSVSLAVTAGDLGADGAKSISAKFTDAAGNTSTTSALAVTLDTTAPVVTQTTASPSTGIEFPGDTVTVTLNLSQAVTVTGTPTLTLNDNGTATYTGGSNSNVLTFSYTVGASDSTVSALAITAVNLPNGATITDAAGNTANLSGALTTFPSLQIDPPAGTPVITQFSPDSGTVGDGVTNATVLTLAGTAVANSTVNVYDGATLVGTVTADGSGAWSLPTGTLSNGPHSFTATDTVSGSTSAASAALNVTVDTVAPTGGTPDLVAGSDSGSSNTDNLTNVTSPTFTVALNSTVAAGDIVQLLLGGSALAHNVLHTITAADVTAGSVSLAVTAGDLGADGAKSISAKFTDTAGNTSTTSALAVTLDTTAPVAPVITTTAPAQDNASSISIAGTAEANSTVTLYNNGVSIGTAAADGTGHWSVNSIALTDNTNYSFTAKATDAAGNTSTASTALAFHDDQTAPAAPTVALASDTGSSSSDHITSNGSLTVTPAEAGGTIQYSTNGGTTWTGSFTAVEGANNVEVRQVDAAGNNGAATSFSFTSTPRRRRRRRLRWPVILAAPVPTTSPATDR